MGDRSEAGWRLVEEKNKGDGKVRSRSKFKVLEIRQPYVVQRVKHVEREGREERGDAYKRKEGNGDQLNSGS